MFRTSPKDFIPPTFMLVMIAVLAQIMAPMSAEQTPRMLNLAVANIAWFGVVIVLMPRPPAEDDDLNKDE